MAERSPYRRGWCLVSNYGSRTTSFTSRGRAQCGSAISLTTSARKRRGSRRRRPLLGGARPNRRAGSSKLRAANLSRQNRLRERPSPSTCASQLCGISECGKPPSQLRAAVLRPGPWHATRDGPTPRRRTLSVLLEDLLGRLIERRRGAAGRAERPVGALSNLALYRLATEGKGEAGGNTEIAS